MTASGASPSKCEADAVSTSRQEGGENVARRHEIGSRASEAKELVRGSAATMMIAASRAAQVAIVAVSLVGACTTS